MSVSKFRLELLLLEGMGEGEMGCLTQVLVLLGTYHQRSKGLIGFLFFTP